jgi:hypothetical protein
VRAACLPAAQTERGERRAVLASVLLTNLRVRAHCGVEPDVEIVIVNRTLLVQRWAGGHADGLSRRAVGGRGSQLFAIAGRPYQPARRARPVLTDGENCR